MPNVRVVLCPWRVEPTLHTILTYAHPSTSLFLMVPTLTAEQTFFAGEGAAAASGGGGDNRCTLGSSDGVVWCMCAPKITFPTSARLLFRPPPSSSLSLFSFYSLPPSSFFSHFQDWRKIAGFRTEADHARVNIQAHSRPWSVASVIATQLFVEAL